MMILPRSWYVADDNSGAHLPAVYTKLHEWDPQHPVTMAISGVGDAWRPTYLAGADIPQPETYPGDDPAGAFDTMAVMSRFPYLLRGT